MTTPNVLRKAVTVPQGPEDAFRLFTDEIASWWPLATHSVGGERAVTVSFDVPGRRLVETLPGGGEAVWGELLAWDPPHRVRLTWHPGTPPEDATTVEVRFTEAPGGGTEVVLVHGDWDRRPDGDRARRDYDLGWDRVLARFTARARARSHPGARAG